MFKKKCKHEYEVIVNEKIYEIEKKSLFDHYPSLFNTSTTTVNFSDELIELLKNKDITKKTRDHGKRTSCAPGYYSAKLTKQANKR